MVSQNITILVILISLVKYFFSIFAHGCKLKGEPCNFLVSSLCLFFIFFQFYFSSGHVSPTNFLTNIPKSPTKHVGSIVTILNIEQIPGFNTTRHIRSSYRPCGKQWPNLPQTHPRAREILVVLEGTLYVCFVTSNQLNNKLFARALNKGDVFVFLIGLIHFQANIGPTSAVCHCCFEQL